MFFKKTLAKEMNLLLVHIVYYEKYYSPKYFDISYQAVNVIWRDKFLDYKKLIASFFGPVSYEYRKRMVDSWTSVPTVLYCSISVLNIVLSFVATIHLQGSVEQQFLRARKQEERLLHLLCVYHSAVIRIIYSFCTTFRS